MAPVSKSPTLKRTAVVAKSLSKHVKGDASAPLKPRKLNLRRPSVENMVKSAILDMKKRKGASAQSIKKYITTNYDVNIKWVAPRIKKYLTSALDNNELVLMSGKGAGGSFILSESAKEEFMKQRKAAEKVSRSKREEKKTTVNSAKKLKRESSKKVKNDSVKKVEVVNLDKKPSVKKVTASAITKLKSKSGVIKTDPSTKTKTTIIKKTTGKKL